MTSYEAINKFFDMFEEEIKKDVKDKVISARDAGTAIGAALYVYEKLTENYSK